MGGLFLLVKLHREGFAPRPVPAACAAGLFFFFLDIWHRITFFYLLFSPLSGPLGVPLLSWTMKHNFSSKLNVANIWPLTTSWQSRRNQQSYQSDHLVKVTKVRRGCSVKSQEGFVSVLSTAVTASWATGCIVSTIRTNTRGHLKQLFLRIFAEEHWLVKVCCIFVTIGLLDPLVPE